VVVSSLLPLCFLPQNTYSHFLPNFFLQLWGQLHASSESGKMLASAKYKEGERERRPGENVRLLVAVRFVRRKYSVSVVLPTSWTVMSAGISKSRPKSTDWTSEPVDCTGASMDGRAAPAARTVNRAAKRKLCCRSMVEDFTSEVRVKWLKYLTVEVK
jgi:hypothetical protein